MNYIWGFPTALQATMPIALHLLRHLVISSKSVLAMKDGVMFRERHVGLAYARAWLTFPPMTGDLYRAQPSAQDLYSFR